MRLKKAFLSAALFVLPSSSVLALDSSNFGSAPIEIATGTETLTSAFSGSVERIYGAGNLIVDVAGKLQYLGFQEADVYFPIVHSSSRAFPDARTADPIFTPEERPNYLTGTIGSGVTAHAVDGLSGSITVNKGDLEVGGYLNVWIQFPNNFGPTLGAFSNNTVKGVAGVILNKGTGINFTNTPLNVLNNLAAPLGGSGDTLSKRYNLVHNIKSGLNNDQVDTTFSAGVDSSYRIVIYADNITADAVPGANLGAAGTSIGKLAGAGDVYKFGPADLRILGESENGIGRFTVGSGSVTLASTGGLALATATSVNLSGTDSRQGVSVGVAYKENPPHTDGNPDRWKEAYAPIPGVGSLILTNNQTIRNFQSDFAYSAGTLEDGATTLTVGQAVIQAATDENADEAIVVGTGKGAVVNIDNNTLTILQSRDGVFRGDILATTHDGKTGTIHLTGSATLALILGSYTDANIAVSGDAQLVANVQGLGSGVVSSGGLTIFQDNAGTLKATLTGSSAITILASATINNESGTPIQINENGVAGTLLIGKVQTEYSGALNVRDGVTLEFSSIANEALPHVTAINLAASSTGVTGVRINDSIQTFNSLNGEAGTQLDLSRGTAIINGGVFSGDIIGVGNLIKDGGASLTLDAAHAKYFGATVLKGGSLNVSGSGLSNSSGLVLKSGATATFGGDSAVGALFGEAGAVVNLNGGTLTVGMSDLRRTQLTQELGGGSPLSTNYLGTSATALDLGGATIADFDTAGLGGTPVDVADATRLFLQNVAGLSASEASSLAFAGSIVGSGTITKVGSETLSLTGRSAGFTGKFDVQGGMLRVNWDSINASSGVSLSGSSKLQINADATTGDGNFALPVTSTVATTTLEKVGSGNVTLTGSLSGYAGAINIAEGGLSLGDGATDLTLTGVVTNSGTLIKAGVGTLTLANYSGAGAIAVRGGTLALLPMNDFPLALEVARDAVFSGTLQGNVAASTVVTTSGTGANPGVVRLFGEGSLVATAPDLFAAVKLDLRDAMVFNLGGTSQRLGAFSGTSGTSVALAGGTLIFAPATAEDSTTFDGLLTGNGAVVKEGAGSLSLTATATSTWTGAVTVSAGMLDATPESLGAAANTVFVDTAGTFALRNTDTLNAKTLLQAVTGTGKLAKTGAGEVKVGGIAVTGGVEVREGRLTVTTATTPSVFNSVAIATDATYQVNFANDLTHDAGSADHVSDLSGGHGSLAVFGAHTLFLKGVQSYTGNTELLGGATLDLATNGVTTLNGLAGEAGTTIVTTGALTLVQSVAGTFSGVFTPATALTVQGTAAFAMTGDLATAGLSAVAIDGGILRVDATNTATIVDNGTLEINSTGSADTYAGIVTGSGNVTKLGAGTLRINDTATTRFLQNTGVLTVAAGTLGGNFTTSGDLVVASGAILAPGNSPGTVTVNGDFTLAANSTLLVEINDTTSDKVVVSGTATLAGALRVTQDSASSAQAAGGHEFTIFTAAGGVSGAFSNDNGHGVVSLSAADRTATGVSRVQLVSSGTTVTARALRSIRDLNNFAPHDGIGGLVNELDASYFSGTTPGAQQTAFDAAVGSAGFTAAVNNLSPLGYASEYAMAQDGENRRQALLHDRLDQRRYDRGSSLTTEDAPWEAFIVGGSTFADNDVARDTPTFDYRNFGGLVGLDRKINDGLVVGVAAGYDSGKADIHQGGGKVEMNRGAATLFASGQLTNRWYFDLGVTGGVGLYESKRETPLGTVKGENTGFSGGLNAETGTLVMLTKELHLTPYVAAAYTHHEFDGFTEKGAASRLKVSGWSQDSLRAKAGAGLGWFIPTDWCRFKLGLDAAYAHELLDTSSDIDARFASGGSRFGTEAAALPDGAVSFTPSLGLQFDESLSVTAGYTYEIGLDGRNYQSVNLALRKRF